MLKVCLIIGGCMLFIGVISNVAAFVLEKKYKSRMQNVSNNK